MTNTLDYLADFGLESGKTEISLGYGSYKVTNTHSADGIFISVTQPLTL